MNSKIIFCSLLTTLISLFSHLLLAETGNYQIELLVFSQKWPNTEVFEQTVSKIEWPGTLTELSTYAKADYQTLNDSATALSGNSAYQLMLQEAWIQSIEENSPGNPVHVQSTDRKVNGYVQMERGQTLQLVIDLEYTPGQTGTSGEAIIYHLHEKRTFQFNDLLYLDHPMFGAVAKISAITP
ncbi:MAG: hypothetical protein HOP23_01795 [Methylococcaceae bacterium]|nr:hypothetical protein [Methylococcaceae bacterium]